MAQHDLLLVVPKADELAVVERALEADFSAPAGELLATNVPFYELQIADVSTVVVALEGQGNERSSLATNRAIEEFNPVLAFIVGTAIGNPSRCGLCDVVVSELVHDLTQTVAHEDGRVTYRPHQIEPVSKIRREMGRFLQDYDPNRLATAVESLLGLRLNDLLPDTPIRPKLSFEHIASGNQLIKDPNAAIWTQDDRYSCYDMESAGFASAAQQHNEVYWMTIRGISDFGDADTKKSSELRRASTAAAIVFARDFLHDGLRVCHPRTLRPPVERSTTLAPGQFYTRMDGLGWFKDQLSERHGIEIPHHYIGRDITLDTFAAICERSGVVDHEAAVTALNVLRSEYFDLKYRDYDYTDDIRGYIPGWADEIHDILRELGVRLQNCTVLDVGVGNGLELVPLFVDAKTIIGVDLSEDMLGRASERLPSMQKVCAPAEQLATVAPGSVDLYVSLRAYMSRFFDMRKAIGEAYRVLKPGGYVLISIANGYLNKVDEELSIVRGLKVSGTVDVLDEEEPHQKAAEVRQHLRDIGFEDIEYHSRTTDIYVWARSPRSSHSPHSPEAIADAEVEHARN